MAHKAFPCEVLTPDGEAFNGEVTQISTRTSIGSIGVLAGHVPLLAMLDPTELRLYKSESDIERYAQGEGFLQVTHDSQVLVLVDELQKVEDLDAADLKERLKRAEDELSRCEPDTEGYRVAERAKRRYDAFLKLASGS
jgi:F-type H+-transporting ATPase subunit epsilon